MKPTSIATLVLATLIAIGSACWIGAREPPTRKPYPKATPPPPASPIYTQSPESAPSLEDIEREAREHDARLEAAIERALYSRDPTARETAFTFLLPEMIQVVPERAVALHARQKPGEPRDVLRMEIARQWITRDRDAAIRWIESLQEPERRAAAFDAVRELTPVAPEQAIYVADAFGIGRDDGFIDGLVRNWAKDNAREVQRWLATQPEGARTSALRAHLTRMTSDPRRN
jgi:hypothetical protein